ncbi:FAD-dependent oxidoreductase [Candidatus Uhrbacteria bacterium]|nr:FAD-dependent oxidoreductase [Candidatus Uhrbacteria bacterium]
MSKRIVIIGAGFAGLLTARNLARRCHADEQIFLVDPRPRFVFTPWLVDVLAGDMKMDEITHPIDEIAGRSGFSFIQGKASEVVREERRVIVETADDIKSVGYDVLLLCQGAHTAFYGIPGTQECCLPLKVEEDVRRIHGAVKALLEQGGGTAAVIGGGPTGIEAVFSLKRYAEKQVRENPKLGSVSLSLTLVQAAPQILPGFSTTLVDHVAAELKRQGIVVSVGDPVARVEDHTIVTNSGKRIQSDMTVWAAGIEANTVPIAPEPETNHGYLIVDNYMHLGPDIFVAGDVASFRLHNAVVPKTAQAAMQMAGVLTKNVLAALYGKDLKPFNIENKGFIITLGTTAVASLFHRLTIKSSLFMFLRKVFYRARFKEIVG